jgi:methionyl-tRNA synthetase
MAKRFGSSEAQKVKEEEVAMKARKSASMRAGKTSKEQKE